MKLLWLLFLCAFAISAKSSLIRLPRVTGVTKARPRIIGGETARAGQYPWQVAIYKTTSDGTYFCSGALISDIWVLTAAQCVWEALTFEIHLGSNLLQGTDPNRVILATGTYFHEPRFDPDSSLAHDIGLIKFRQAIELNDYIQTIDYANMGYLYPGRVVEAVGWGQISDQDGGLSNNLQYTTVTILDQNECQAYYGSQLWNSMICAEGNFNQGTCYGDVGGPLVTPHLYQNKSITVGISSWISTNGCESTDPSGYTRVDSYYNWIRNTTRDN